jgi:signal transduction histidine kinase
MPGRPDRPILGLVIASMEPAWPFSSAFRAALLDIALALAALAGSLAMMAHGIGSTRPGAPLNVVGVILAAAMTLPLLAWRRGPVPVFVVTAVAGALAAGLGYSLGLHLGATVALFLVAASRDRQTPWNRGTTILVGALFVLYLAATAFADAAFPAIEIFHTGLAWAVAWFAGERTRLLRERMNELRHRAVAAEAAAERERRLAVAEERARIARDLHDSAAHAINVIAVRAGAARMSHGSDSDRSQAALHDIEEVARQTAHEIDVIVSSLRDRSDDPGDAGLAPLGLASLSTLVGQHVASGLRVAVRARGGERPLSNASDQAAYRILQEALTNAARHGSGEADVELAYGQSDLQVTVSNRASPLGRPGKGGHGLIGMRERAVLAGGTLEAGAVDGGFRVTVRIPYELRRP